MPLDIITAEDLSAYVDGELPRDVAVLVRQATDDDDRAARLVAAFREQIANLHRLYGGAATEPVPERLLETLRRRRPTTREE